MADLDPASWGIEAATAALIISAVVIGLTGTWLTWTTDRLAEVTGLGEALLGAVLLGGSTSLAGIITSVSAAAQGYGDLAVSNAIGGIAAQTTFLAVADLTYRRANLEHASASVANLMNGVLLAALLALVMLAGTVPSVVIAGVHPVSIALVVGYLAALHVIRTAKESELWTPKMTPVTQREEMKPATSTEETHKLWTRFGGLAVVVGFAGWVVARSGIVVVETTGLSEAVVGVLFTAIVTSLPELVTSLVAVHSGALTLAVGGILGGNAFDVLFVAFADGAFRQGSIYHVMHENHVFLMALALLLTTILLLGLLRRQRRGLFGMGFESALVLLLYLGAMVLFVFTG